MVLRLYEVLYHSPEGYEGAAGVTWRSGYKVG